MSRWNSLDDLMRLHEQATAYREEVAGMEDGLAGSDTPRALLERDKVVDALRRWEDFLGKAEAVGANTTARHWTPRD